MLWLIVRLLVDVRLATLAGAALAGEPDLGPVLVEVARRESSLQLVSVHEGDARYSDAVRPRGCTGDGWSTRGVHGVMAGHTAHHLPAPLRCSPWLFDVPIVSAYASARRAASWRCRAHSRCRSWLAVKREGPPRVSGQALRSPAR